jgi:hypothetical protein
MSRRTRVGLGPMALILLIGVAAPEPAAASPDICVKPFDVVSEWTEQYEWVPAGDPASCAKACKTWVKSCKKAIGAYQACEKKNSAADKTTDSAGCKLLPTKEEFKLCTAAEKTQFKNYKPFIKTSVLEGHQWCEDAQPDCVVRCEAGPPPP